MTVFMLVCAAMVLAALVWLAWPMLRPVTGVVGAATPAERRGMIAALAILLPLISGGLYAKLSNWKWDDPTVEREMHMSAQIGAMQAHVRNHPEDVDGWQQLARAYVELGQFSSAITAYEKAYRLTAGKDASVTASLGEAMVLTDESALQDRASQLFEEALALSPAHPKALFYSSIGAMRSGKLGLARERLQALLAQNPPEQLRPVLERQIQDLDEQIKNGGPLQAQANAGSDAVPASAAKQRVVKVSVSIAPSLRDQLRAPQTLFILARDPTAGGPPLAVERHSSSELPLAAELSEADAMLPSRTIGTVGEALIVARLSQSGTPQQQSGDYFGEARLQFDANKADQEYNVNIVIDRRVP